MRAIVSESPVRAFVLDLLADAQAADAQISDIQPVELRAPHTEPVDRHKAERQRTQSQRCDGDGRHGIGRDGLGRNSTRTHAGTAFQKYLTKPRFSSRSLTRKLMRTLVPLSTCPCSTSVMSAMKRPPSAKVIMP